MKRSNSILALGCGFLLGACSTTADAPAAIDSKHLAPITLAEAKAEACPEALLEAGASPKDCSCIEKRLYTLGQDPGALTSDSQPKALFGGEDGRRKIAIGLLRHDAIDHCGLFNPDHIVAKNL